MNTPLVKGIHHASVLVSDLERAVDFYCGVLGLTPRPERPAMGYPGAWLSAADGEIHLLQLPSPDPVHGRPDHVGRDRHIALSVEALEPLQERLQERGIAWTMSRSGRQALFCRDPDGNGLELIQC
jgi:glyoxylase I family protein